MTTEQELNEKLARWRFGNDNVSWWSIHLIESETDIPTDVRWRHGVFSRYNIERNLYPTEILVADDSGDMPLLEVCIDGEWQGLINFPHSLDACFKWLVPKLGYVVLQFEDGEYYADASIDEECGECYGVGTPALALCRAIEQLIDKEANYEQRDG